MFHSEKNGPHNVFYNTVIKKAVGDHDIRYLPYRRAIRDFSVRRADCLYVATDNEKDYPAGAVANGEIIFSRAMNRIHLRAYTRRDMPPIRAISDFEGKVVAGSKSHLAQLEPLLGRSTSAALIGTIDQVKAFELLEEQRVDVVISFGLDAMRAATELGMDLYPFDENFVIETWNEVLACWKSPDTELLIGKLDKAISTLEASNKLDTIFGRHYAIPGRKAKKPGTKSDKMPQGG